METRYFLQLNNCISDGSYSNILAVSSDLYCIKIKEDKKMNTYKLTTLNSMLLEFFLRHSPDVRTFDLNQRLLDAKLKQGAAKDKIQQLMDYKK